MAQPIPGKRKLVVIEDSTLAGMALNAQITKEFPFLQSLARQPRGPSARRGCGRCGAGASQQTAVFQAAKQTIANLDAIKKRRLKELLNAEQARITFSRPGGRPMVLTF